MWAEETNGARANQEESMSEDAFGGQKVKLTSHQIVSVCLLCARGYRQC